MDKFETQIALLRPKDTPAKLDERQFMKKLQQAQRTQRIRRMLFGSMATSGIAVLAGALSRNILEMFALTARYIGDLPALFGEYARAYTATISWPGLMAFATLAALLFVMIKTRTHRASALDTRTYQFAAALAVLAFSFSIAGLFSSPGHANAAQQALKRRLNEKGHLEVRIDGKDYELYGKSQATDASIRNQAFIQKLRTFDYKKAYPELNNVSRDGEVGEVRAINPKDPDCYYYFVERRMELNHVIDASAGCAINFQPVFYLNDQLQPVRGQKLRVGQAAYVTYGTITDKNRGAPMSATIIVLLSGKADDYVAASGNDKLVPKGQPGQGMQSCGINLEDDCPESGSIDVFANGQGFTPSGELGSAITASLFNPQDGSSRVRVFGKITELSGKSLHLITPSKRTIVISLQRNVIAEFNASGAKNYPTVSGPLHIAVGDSLYVDLSYKDGMDLENLSLSDVQFISLVIKTTIPDPLNGEQYDKQKAMSKGIEKY